MTGTTPLRRTTRAVSSQPPLPPDIAPTRPRRADTLIDISRSGWGGTRPSGPDSPAGVVTSVDRGRFDRRIHIGNWCDQSGAGLGGCPRRPPIRESTRTCDWSRTTSPTAPAAAPARAAGRWHAAAVHRRAHAAREVFNEIRSALDPVGVRRE
ncbi:hypothetical protein GCM10010446_25260 [Streptomyces enissocaesilis]|uniref:Uncharacterized protein n=1 Tax=Streptomyces enissocaesilis TaxID=332589 RepID=A0ABP6JN64_9ACTN